MHRLLLALAALLFALPAAAQVRQIDDAPDPWVHKGTGTSFPSRIGDFQRHSVTEYNRDGTDASIGYDLVRGDKKIGYLTVYIYPPYAEGDCATQFDGVKRDVNSAYPKVEQISEAAAPSPGGEGAKGLSAEFRITAKFAEQEQALLSDAYLFCPAGGKWLVMYRASWPADGDIRADVATLMHTIRWPDQLDR